MIVNFKYLFDSEEYNMQIYNLTKETALAPRSKSCRNLFSQGIGLMFSKKITNLGLVFIFKKEKIIPLHMLFVFYPIDVLWLDKERKVVQIKEKLKPFHMISPRKKAKYIIELPEGTIRKTETEVGDQIQF